MAALASTGEDGLGRCPELAAPKGKPQAASFGEIEEALLWWGGV